MEVSSCLQVRPEEVTASLTELVSCVGCRRSVEAVFQTLRTSVAGDKALEPLTVSNQGIVTVNRCGLRVNEMKQILYVILPGSTLERMRAWPTSCVTRYRGWIIPSVIKLVSLTEARCPEAASRGGAGGAASTAWTPSIR